MGRRPLLYYHPNYPKINTELNAVVSHINNPADFHIQLVLNMLMNKYTHTHNLYNVLNQGSDIRYII